MRLASWLACALVVMACPAFAQVAIAPDCRLEAGPTRAVARVLDGETVLLDNGGEVRLIGALAPRAFDVGAKPDAWPPEQAAIQALTDLVQGRSVALFFGGRKVDRYGRTLAHVTVEASGKQEWVQGAMLEQGMARAYSAPGNQTCLNAMIARERPAREAQRGLWANAAYHVRAASAGDDLVPLRHTFQLIRGIIAGVSSAHGQIYLNFGPRHRAAFSVALTRTANALPGVQADNLKGRTVLARGWVELHAGPVIKIDTPGQLELIDTPDQPDWSAGRTRQKIETPGEHAAGRR